MIPKSYKKALFIAVLALFALAACSDDDVKPNLRAKIDYSLATSSTPYTTLFVDANASGTVDLSEGNTLHKMFQSINYYSTSSVSNNTTIDADKLKSMFANTGNQFIDISTSSISVIGSELNASGMNVKEVTASSFSSVDATTIKTKIESLFTEMATVSGSVNSTASSGSAGKLGNYLVDEKGIEIAQVIQKSLIGALQLDYIGNVLLTDGLNAENYTLVDGKLYTQLEHNWDMAYGIFTLNPIYLEGATNDVRNTIEFGLGSYVWEYNKINYANIYPAFLKGRVAIVNNDRAELQKQALFLRTEFEKSIANAALGYLNKWKTGSTDAARAHAIGEALGFIYSLRFAKVHNVSTTFSDNVINDLVGSTNGFWDLDATKINNAIEVITLKFNL